MRFKFPSADAAQGFADGLANPDELDVYALVEGDVLEVLGCHKKLIEEISRLAQNSGAVVLEELDSYA
jgi:hypothetical protein